MWPLINILWLVVVTVNMGGWWRWALVSPDGVAPSRIVCVSASVNLPLHHKVHKFSSGTGSPVWSRKKNCKMVVVWWYMLLLLPWCIESVRPAEGQRQPLSASSATWWATFSNRASSEWWGRRHRATKHTEHRTWPASSRRHDSHSISDNKTTLATWTQTLTPIHVHQSKEMYSTTQNTHKKLKPGLVASYNIRPGNGEGRYWFRRFINSLPYLLGHLRLPTYLQPRTHTGHLTSHSWGKRCAVPFMSDFNTVSR